MSVPAMVETVIDVIPCDVLKERLSTLRRQVADDEGGRSQFASGYFKAVDAEIEFLAGLLEPDPVCGCGKTSEGLCPRCGQNMS
jgi:hypothetical protein